MIALLFLLASAFLGVRIVNLTLGTILTKIEQFFFGIIVGWIVSTVFAYGIAYSFGRLSFSSMLGLSLAIQLIAAAVWFPVLRRTRWKKIWKRFFKFDYLIPAFLLFLFAPLFYYLYSIRMFYPQADGLYSGGNSWNDMALHLAISSSFVYGENFPPGFPAFAGETLRYPFMPDFQTAILMALDLTTYTALMLTAVPLALTITGLFYCLGVRIVNSRRVAFLATILFLFNGGFGFIYFLEDWRQSKKTFFEFWGDLPVNYANHWGEQLHWANVIVDCFLPQRTSLYGIPVALMTFIIFAIVWRGWNETPIDKKWDGWQLLLFAGMLVGVLPLFHAHTFVAVGLISIFLFLIAPRREWLVFWIPAVSVAALQMISQLSLENHLTSGKFFWFQPSWKGSGETSWLLYWIRNVGVPLLLLFPAWRTMPRPWQSFYLAFFCLFIFCFFIMVTPHDYDNIKLFYYWYGLTCIIVAKWIVNLARRRRQYLLAVVLVALSTATGILAIQKERKIHWRSFSQSEMAAADFVLKNTAPKSIFLTAPQHNQPVMCLAGRTILMGYGGWLWTHGYQTQPRETDIRRIYAGDPQAQELLQRYQVEYIYLSLAETAAFDPNVGWLNRTFPVFYQNGEITIYKVAP